MAGVTAAQPRVCPPDMLRFSLRLRALCAYTAYGGAVLHLGKPQVEHLALATRHSKGN